MRNVTAQSIPEVTCAVLLPHAPILVPGVGSSRQHQAAATVHAMEAVSRRVVQHRPEAVVLISPHSPRRRGAFGIWAGPRLTGSLEQFEAPEAGVDLPGDSALAQAIEREATARGITMWHIHDRDLDHGTVVPLWHLVHGGWEGPTVVLSLNYPGEGGLVELGGAIAAAANQTGRRIAVVASGDMSHCLAPGAPGGFNPQAQQFDHEFIRLLRRGAYRDVPRVDAELQELAGEDVVDSTVVALAAVDWNSTGHEVLSYEGPFGVGYGVAVLFDPKPTQDEAVSEKSVRSAGDELLSVARQSLETAFALREARPPRPAGGFLAAPRAVFVTIRNRTGGLRGCVGTLSPRFPHVTDETWHLARSAAFEDTRFPPLEAGELSDVRLEVSVLHPLEAIESPAELDPERYGVVVSTDDGRRGTLLPGIASVDTAAEQLRIARLKARIDPDEPVRLERFTVEKFKEPGFIERED